MLCIGSIGGLCLVLLAAAAPPMRPGLDIEDDHPPYARDNPVVAQMAAALSVDDDAKLARLAQQFLARPARNTPDDKILRVQVLCLYGRSLLGQGQPGALIEAETQFGQAREILKTLIDSGKVNRPDLSATEKAARTWAGYVETYLRYDLVEEHREGEADRLKSIVPAAADARPAQPSQTEFGVSFIPGIETDPCLPGAIRSRGLQRPRYAEGVESAAQARCRVAVDQVKQADAAFDQGRPDEALRLGQGALQILDGLDPELNLDETLNVLADLARIARARSGPGAAQSYLERMVAILEHRMGASDGATGSARVELANNLYAQNRIAEAEILYRRALLADLPTDDEGAPLARKVRLFTAQLAEAQGQFGRAVADYRLECKSVADTVALSQRGGRATLQDTPDKLQAGQCALRYALVLWRWAQSGGGPALSDRPDALMAEAFEAAQRASLTTSADALARAVARIAAARTGADDLADQYEAAVKARDAAGVAPRPLGPYAAAPETAEQQAERERRDALVSDLAARLETADPRYWEFRTPSAPALAVLQTRAGPDSVLLHDNEVLLLFVIAPGSQKGLVFAVSKDRAAWAQIGLTGDELAAIVARLRAQIDPEGYGMRGIVALGAARSAPTRSAFDRQAAYRLYQALLGDGSIQAVIKDKPVLLFVPSGPLTSLPPGLLVTAPPAGGAAGDADPKTLRETPWLLRSKALALLPAVSALKTLRQFLPPNRAETADPLLAFADPDFGGRPGVQTSDTPQTTPRSLDAYFRDGRPMAEALHGLPPLPGTRIEGEALEKALGGAPGSLLMGADASKAQLMARNADGRLAKVRVLEFATHGLVAGDASGLAEPALALAAGARPEDELLLASEAATLHLNADWVLLSACNTASPDAPEAQGLSGLARAFFFAGARSLLVSHWRVRDDVAARLIPAMLLAERNTPGLSHAEALRQASLAMLDDPALNAASPAAWAPFTLVGEAGR